MNASTRTPQFSLAPINQALPFGFDAGFLSASGFVLLAIVAPPCAEAPASAPAHRRQMLAATIDPLRWRHRPVLAPMPGLPTRLRCCLDICLPAGDAQPASTADQTTAASRL